MLPCWMITMDERKASGNGGKETQAVFEEQTKIGPEPSTPFTEENEGIVCVQEDPGEEFDFDDVEVAPADIFFPPRIPALESFTWRPTRVCDEPM